jgi:Zn-dependent protease
LIGIFFFVLAKIAFGQNSPLLDQNIPLLMSIAGANILLMFQNLAPAFPFDGGLLLQMLLGMRISTTRAKSRLGSGRYLASFLPSSHSFFTLPSS